MCHVTPFCQKSEKIISSFTVLETPQFMQNRTSFESLDYYLSRKAKIKIIETIFQELQTEM